MVPPLRERKEDIPLLVNHFLQIYSKKNNKNIKGISKKAIEILLKYDWPGNVRELENVIERAVVLAKNNVYIDTPNLPPELLEATDKKTGVSVDERTITIPIGKIPLKEIERIVMEETLKQSKGNKNIASKILGISARTLYRKFNGQKD